MLILLNDKRSAAWRERLGFGGRARHGWRLGTEDMEFVSQKSNLSLHTNLVYRQKIQNKLLCE